MSTLSGLAKSVALVRFRRYPSRAPTTLPYGTRGLSLHRYDPNGEPLADVMYVHGGGFRFFNKESAVLLAETLCDAGFRVYVPDYRKAPPHAYPASLLDVADAAMYVQDASARAPILWMGDSAGAHLALSLCLATLGLLDAPIAQTLRTPSAVLVSSALLEVARPERWASDPYCGPVPRLRLRFIAQAIRPSDPLPALASDDARALVARVPSLPPICIQSGSGDPILSESVRLEETLKTLGWPHTRQHHEGATHSAILLPVRLAGRPAQAQREGAVRFAESIVRPREVAALA